MRKTVWTILVILALPAISATHERLVTLKGRWQFSVEDEGAAALIQDAPNHLMFACYAGESLLEMQVGKWLYPYHEISELPIVIAVKGGDIYTPTFEIDSGEP